MVHVMFCQFLKNLKSSFSKDNIPVHALDVFIENATKMVCIIPLKTKTRIKL